MKRALVLAVVLAALAGPAVAHRGHATLTVVEIDAASGAVKITHRMAAHDLEPALSLIAPDAQPSVDDIEAMKAFEAYAGRRFQLWDAEGRAIPLTHQKTELAGDDVELVYRATLPSPAKAVAVDSGLLEDVHADQENQVNIRRAKITRTLLFRAGDGPQQLSFP